MIFFKGKQLYPQGFFYERKRVLTFFLFSHERSPGNEVESLRGLLTLRWSVNQSRVHIKIGSLLRKNKQERTK